VPWLLEDVGEYCRWKRNKNRMQLEDEDADLRATKKKSLAGRGWEKGGMFGSVTGKHCVCVQLKYIRFPHDSTSLVIISRRGNSILFLYSSTSGFLRMH
jgi:hypothetical protein